MHLAAHYNENEAHTENLFCGYRGYLRFDDDSWETPKPEKHICNIGV